MKSSATTIIKGGKDYSSAVLNNYKTLRGHGKHGGHGRFSALKKSFTSFEYKAGQHRWRNLSRYVSRDAIKFGKGLGRVAKGGGLGIVGALGNMALAISGIHRSLLEPIES